MDRTRRRRTQAKNRYTRCRLGCVNTRCRCRKSDSQIASVLAENEIAPRHSFFHDSEISISGRCLSVQPHVQTQIRISLALQNELVRTVYPEGIVGLKSEYT